MTHWLPVDFRSVVYKLQKVSLAPPVVKIWSIFSVIYILLWRYQILRVVTQWLPIYFRSVVYKLQQNLFSATSGENLVYFFSDLYTTPVKPDFKGSPTRSYTCGKDKMTNKQCWILKMKLEKFFEMRSRPNWLPVLGAQSCLLDFHQKHSWISWIS